MDNNKIDYNLLKVFAKVSELGSFTKAAESLHQPKSRVSRAISRLENELGVQLIRRTTRKTSLTTQGQSFYLKVSPLLTSIQDEILKVSSLQQEMAGTLRITASQDIGETLVAQIIARYAEQYPQVKIETLITNDYLDLNDKNIDVAIRAGKLNDSRLIQKKLLTAKFILVGSKKYIEKHGEPKKIEEIKNHRFISFKFKEKDFLPKDLIIKPTLSSDSIPMILSLILNHQGLSILPDFYCKKNIEDGSIVHLVPNWKTQSRSIHMLYDNKNGLPKKTRAFINLSSEYCK